MKQKFVWYCSMLACAAFLVMAVRLYRLPVFELLSNLAGVLLLATAVACLSLLMALLLSKYRRGDDDE
jgi:hypothetical protein